MSLSSRDEVLRKIKESSLRLAEGDDNFVDIKYAKTKKQLRRNYCVNKAAEMLKHDPRSSGKQVVAEWKHNDKGKRTVTVGGIDAFMQSASDASGYFLAPFEHLHFD